MARCEQGFNSLVFSVMPLSSLYQVQCLAKKAAQAELLFSSMMRA